MTQWTKAYWDAVHPFDLGGAYPNFMMDDEGDARLKATYGDNYIRLAAVKKTYDPANLFQGESEHQTGRVKAVWAVPV